MQEEFKFDFSFGEADSEEMLSQAKQELLELKGDIAESDQAPIDQEVQETEEFFATLAQGKIEFPQASPTVFPIDVNYFQQNDVPVPKNFHVLSKTTKFYWVEVPIFIVPGEKPFNKLQMWMEFSEDADHDKQIPKVHSAFPDHTFAEIIALKGALDFGLGEDIRFKVAAGLDEVAVPESIPLVNASAGGQLGVDASLASKIGLVAGPFSYTIKHEVVKCNFAGEKVLWTITGAKTLQEEPPIFIVILQVPKEVTQVELRARLQAHRKASLPESFAQWLDKIAPERANWLQQGSPIRLPLYAYSINTP